MPVKPQRENSWFKEVIQVPLLPEHIESIKTWVLSPSDALEMLAAYTQTGHSFTTSYDAMRESYGVGVTCSDPQDTNYGLRFYANSKTFEGALKTALFKLNFLGALPTWKDAIQAGGAEYS